MELSTPIIGILGFILLFIFFALGMPIAFAFLFVGFLGLWYVRGLESAMSDLPVTGWNMITSYVLICLPLFIFMGNLANYSGIGPDVYQSALKWWGRLPGGIAITTIFGNAFFGAITGASLAGLVTFTPIAWKPMIDMGYDKRLASGSLICSGTLSQLIPPSLSFILYSAVTNESIGKLFVAGIFPGVLQSVMYAIIVLIVIKMGLFRGPSGPSSSWKEKIASFKGIWGVAAIFIILIGGIYLGIFTPTEGAAIGVVGVFIIFVIKQGFKFKLIVKAINETLRTSAMLFFILFSSMTFAHFIAASGMSSWICNIVINSGFNEYVILSLALVILIIAGCVMPATPMIVLFVPLFYPIFVTKYGMDGIWFGVIVTVMAELALCTPPVGLHLFAFPSIVKEEITIPEMWQGVLPFIIIDILRMIILIVFPCISLWLPNKMF